MASLLKYDLHILFSSHFMIPKCIDLASMCSAFILYVCVSLISTLILYLLFRECYTLLCGISEGIASADESQRDTRSGFSSVVSDCWLTPECPFSLLNAVSHISQL